MSDESLNEPASPTLVRTSSDGRILGCRLIADFSTDDHGDVTGVDSDGVVEVVDPYDWGWTARVDRELGLRASGQDVLNTEGAVDDADTARPCGGPIR